MPQGRPLYRCVAGVKPNNLPQTESESAVRLWSNLLSSKVPPACYLSPPSGDVSEILGFDATETSFIPLRSWRRAQQPPVNRI